MRLDDYRTSDNVQDDRGNGGGFGFGGGGGFGGFGGLLFGLVLSRFGIGGVLILLVGYCALSTLGGGGGNYGVSGPATVPGQTSRAGGGSVCAASAETHLSCQVLASTEDTWSTILGRQGQRYTPTKLVFYTGGDQSGCGMAQSAMGPFYCPTDGKIYLDTSFFDELKKRFHATGKFAEAYVIAHEVGHHIQDLNGTLGQVERRQQAVSSTEGNALQVRIELQADCFAGVWAANAKSRAGQPILEPGDAEAGLRAASAIGDDTLQRETQGTVVPDSFTHGTSAQRVAWLRKGLESGDPAACDTFGAASLNAG